MTPSALNTTVFFVINLIILFGAYILNKRFFKSLSLISLPFLFSFFMFFFYIVIHTYIYFSNNISLFYSDTVNSVNIIKALVLATFVNLFFFIGCCLNIFIKNKKHRFISHARRFSPKKLFITGLIIFSIGILTKLIFFIVQGGGNPIYYVTHYFAIQIEDAGKGASFTSYLNFLYTFIDVGTDLLLINTLKNKTHKYVTISAIILAVLFSFNTRLNVIKLVFQYVIIFSVFKPKFRKKLPVIMGIAILPFIFLLVVGLGIAREYSNDMHREDLNPAYFFLGSIHGIKALSDGFEYYKDFGAPLYGKSIILPIIQKPIPRRYWANKQLNGSAVWTHTMRPGSLEAGFSIAAGLIFDTYINFGYFGTLIFFMVWGFILFRIQAMLYLRLCTEKDHVFTALIMAISASLMLTLRGTDVSSSVFYILYYVLPVFLVFFRVKIKV